MLLQFEADVVKHGGEVLKKRKKEPGCLSKVLQVALRIAFLAVAIGVVFSLMGEWGYPFELFCHFQMQYLIAFGILALLFLVLGRWQMTIFCLVVGLVPLAKVLPLYLTADAPSNIASDNSQESWRLMVLNVNTHEGDPKRVLEQIEAWNPDLIVLVEISAKWVETLQELEERYPYFVLEPKYNNFGIGVYSRERLGRSEVRAIGEAQLATIFAEVKLNEEYLTLIATHPMPPIGKERLRLRDDQLRQLADEIPQQGAVMVCGDFNATRWSPITRAFLQTTGLRDSALGFGWQPTWPVDKWPLRIPIDHCFQSDSIRIIDRQIGADVGSDHLPVLVEFLME